MPCIILLMSSEKDLLAGPSEAKDTPPRHYTLSDLYQLALQHAEEIRFAEENLLIAQEDKQRALSVIIPRLSVFGDYINYKDTDATFPKTVSYGAKFDQTFTTNGRELTALKMAGDYISQNEFDLENIKEAYLFEVATAYYGILRTTKTLEISKADVNRLKQHKEAVKSRFDLGDVTKTAMIRADAELSGSKSILVRSENALHLARFALSRLVPLPMDYLISDPAFSIHPISYELAQVKKEAVLDRADLKALKKLTEASLKQIKWSKGAYYPVLSLEGKYFDTESEWSETDPMTGMDNFNTDNYSIHLQLIFTLFDGGLKKAELRQARAQYRQALLLYQSKVKEVCLAVETAYLDLVTQKSMLQSLEDQLKFSEENFKAITEQFDIGLSNSIDVMDANTLLVKAEREFSDARFKYVLADLNLKRAKGSFMNQVQKK